MRERERERERKNYRSLLRCRSNVAYENYKVAKEEAMLLMMNYIASWGQRMEKRIFINLLRPVK